MIVDTHLHLFDPASRRFDPGAPYQPAAPECATWPALRDLMAAHGVHQGWLVAPTAGYDRDRGALPHFLAQSGNQLRGVARLHGDEDDAELGQLAAAGVVGVRLDLRHDPPALVRRLREGGIVSRWADRGWFVEIQAEAAVWRDVIDEVGSWPVPLVIDHCGWPDPQQGTGSSDFGAVCELARRPLTWAKLSAVFRFSHAPWPHDDTLPFVDALRRGFGPERCLWGSDWPFVRMAQRLDYGAVVGLLSRGVPDADERIQILQRSPLGLLAAGAA